MTELRKVETNPLPLDDNMNEHVNPFVKAIKDQRLDFNYVTSLRKEVIQLIEPFRVKTLETADTLEEVLYKLEKMNTEQFAFKDSIATQMKAFATKDDMKARNTMLSNELNEQIDKLQDTTRGHHNRLIDMEKRV